MYFQAIATDAKSASQVETNYLDFYVNRLLMVSK